MTHQMLLAGPAAETTRLVSYWVLAIVAAAAAVGMVLARRAVHCALMLAVVMLSLAVMYAMLGAVFLAFVQVIVYTGAVLMLFLFVLMIVGITTADSVIETIRGQRLWAFISGVALLVLLALVIGNATIGSAAPNSPQYSNNNVTDLAHLIFAKYVFPFELTSALLITAALGAMVLAHRERTSPKPTQRELAGQRIASGRPTPLPGPGTYAQHNAADMPALLPDGSQSRLSVSPVLAPARPADETPPESLSRGESGGRPPGQQLPSGPVGSTANGTGSGTVQSNREAGDQW
jgi:NADH-quinone oxidoreductase subunit J